MDGVVKMADMILGFIGGFVGFMFGGWTFALTIFLVIQSLDIITGMMASAKHGKLESKIMKDGLIEKFGVWVLCVLAHFIDMILFDNSSVALTGLIFTFVGKEGMSIIENLSKMGVYIPKQIGKYFSNIQEKGEGEEEK